MPFMRRGRCQDSWWGTACSKPMNWMNWSRTEPKQQGCIKDERNPSLLIGSPKAFLPAFRWWRDNDDDTFTMMMISSIITLSKNDDDWPTTPRDTTAMRSTFPIPGSGRPRKQSHRCGKLPPLLSISVTTNSSESLGENNNKPLSFSSSLLLKQLRKLSVYLLMQKKHHLN